MCVNFPRCKAKLWMKRQVCRHFDSSFSVVNCIFFFIVLGKMQPVQLELVYFNLNNLWCFFLILDGKILFGMEYSR